MRRFFASRVEQGQALVLGGEAEHFIRVLRMKPGDEFIALYQGEELVCVAETVQPGEVCGRILESRACMAEPAVRMTLYIAYMKADKMELVLQKAVELGISCFVPFLSSRCVKRPKEGAKANERFARIADSAVKQCGRASSIQIEEMLSLADALERMKRHEAVLFAYENAEIALKQVFNKIGPKTDIALIVGPEGGFSPEEAQQITAIGAWPVSLGKRILRGETAAIALTALAAYEMGC